MITNSSASVETEKDFGTDSFAKASRWQTEIGLYQKEFSDWNKQAGKIIRRYKDERKYNNDISNRKANRFNVFWANVQTLQPALYSRTPNPQVSRRYNDRDPVARAASEILERSLLYSLDAYDFDEVIRSVRDDYLLVGRGVAWVRYVPHFEEVTPDPIKLKENVQISPDLSESIYNLISEKGEEFEPEDERIQFSEELGSFVLQEEPFEQITYEEVVCDYVHWSDFYHSPARRWSEVRWVARRVFMTRNELRARFGSEVGGEVSLTYSPFSGQKDDDDLAPGNEMFKQAVIYEIWNKDDKKVYWVSDGYEGLLDSQDDFLKLKKFFPCPKPLYSTTTTDSLKPVPDIIFYDGQAKELDDLTSRITMLTRALRIAGVYDKSIGADIENVLLESAENTLYPIDNWTMFAQTGGFNGSVQFFPMAEISRTLGELHQLRAQTKNDVYEITGISDIVRGQGDPRATATAENIKSRFATLRLTDRQKEMERFVRDLIELKAEIIAEHFSTETIALIANDEFDGVNDPQLFQQAVELLRNDPLRSFRIDVETDSTVFVNEQAEKQSTIEFLSTVTSYIREAAIVSQAAPQFTSALGEMLMMAVRKFRAGREVEAAIEASVQETKQQQPQGQQGAQERTRALIEAQQKAQMEAAKLQLEQQKAQGKLQLETAKAQGKLQLEEEKTRRELELEEVKTARELALKEEKLRADTLLAQQKTLLSNGSFV